MHMYDYCNTFLISNGALNKKVVDHFVKCEPNICMLGHNFLANKSHTKSNSCLEINRIALPRSRFKILPVLKNVHLLNTYPDILASH